MAPLLGDWCLVLETDFALETDLSLQVGCFDSSLMPCMDLLLSQEGFSRSVLLSLLHRLLGDSEDWM